jgi:PAS domain S-box-containing protein
MKTPEMGRGAGPHTDRGRGEGGAGGPATVAYRYGLAAVLTLAGLALLRAPLIREGPGNGELMVALAVLASAWYGGRGPGLLATAIVAYATYRADAAAWRVLRHALIVVDGVAISLVVGALHASRRRAEAEAARARAHEERFRRLSESGLIGVAVIDLDGPVREANDEYLRIVGRGHDDVAAGRVDWISMTPPEYLDHDRGKHREIEETGVCAPYVKEYQRPDGSRIAVMVGAALLNEAPARCLMLVRDISARRRAEAALWLLAEAGEVLGASLDVQATLAGMAGLAVPTLGDLCVVHWLEPDGRTREVARAVADPALAAAADALGAADVGAGPAAPVARALRSGEPRLITGARDDDDQAVRQAGLGSAMVVPLSALGRTLGAVVFGAARSGRRFDSDDLALAVELVRRAALAVENARLFDEAQQVRREAERANLAKDRFLAALSHELRTPLTPALVGVTALLDDPDLPDELRLVLEATHRNVALEGRLIDDLLDVTRIAQGKLRLERSVVEVHGLIRQAVEICRDETAAAGVRLDCELNASERYVEGDPARVQQVLWNLIKNAGKFTLAGGRIVVRSRNEPALATGAESNPAPPRLIVEVADTGIGIEPEALSRIFDAFEQGDPAITARFGGLGLGLAISRSLAEAHGGRLTAASAGHGLGAVFTLELPTVPALAVPAAEGPAGGTASVPAGPLSPLRILLAEDHLDTLRVMARLLDHRGHRVSAAASYAMALHLAEVEGPFDLVISDIGLPDGSGLDLMRQLTADRPLPGIALSGFGTDEDVRRSLDAGFLLHLTKPVAFSTLEDAIRRVVRSAR